MAGKIKNDSGFTLVELVVVLLVVCILISIAMSNYNTMSRRNRIYSDLNKMSSFLQDKRLQAFSQKQTVTFTLAGNTLTSAPGGESVVVENSFIGGPFTVNSRGLFSVGGNFHLTGTDYGAAYSCVVVASTRVRMGEWDSGTGVCNAK